MSQKLWDVVESYTVTHSYDVRAETAEDAVDKLNSFISCQMHTEDVEHIPSCDETDNYNIECTDEIKENQLH